MNQIERLEKGVAIMKPKWNLFWIMLFFLLYSAIYCYANPLPENEIKVINQVADEYELEGEARTLLFVIRIIENGKTPREFGVLVPRAMRYPDNPDKSFLTQARWAAGTIKKRFNGDLKAFADRYCPIDAENDPTGLNKNWYPNAKYWMNKLRGTND